MHLPTTSPTSCTARPLAPTLSPRPSQYDVVLGRGAFKCVYKVLGAASCMHAALQVHEGRGQSTQPGVAHSETTPRRRRCRHSMKLRAWRSRGTRSR